MAAQGQGGFRGGYGGNNGGGPFRGGGGGGGYSNGRGYEGNGGGNRGRGGGGRGRGGGPNFVNRGPRLALPVSGPDALLDHRQEFAEKKEHFEAAVRGAQANGQSSEVFVARPGFSPPGKTPGTIYTNHFAIDLPDKLYQYKILGLVTDSQAIEDKKPTRGRRMELMDLALKASEILTKHRKEYATDNLENIISWKDLSLYRSGKPVAADPGAIVAEFDIVTSSAHANKNGEPVEAKKMELQLRFEGEIPVKKIKEASSGKIDHLPLDPTGANTMTIVQAVNIIIGESARSPNGPMRAFQIGSNKFFSGDISDRKSLGLGLTCCNGYFFTLKHGMGQPLLNVSSATSAFYDKITVAEFMRLFCEKRPGQPFDDRDLAVLKHVLRKVRVEIMHEDNRVKSIDGLSKQPPSSLQFTMADDKKISVADYLKAHNSKLSPKQKMEIGDSQCFCIKIGEGDKARHFPAETLSIVPRQLFKGTVPPAAVGDMITFARVSPGDDRSNIVLKGLPMLNDRSILGPAGIAIKQEMTTLPFRLVERPKITYFQNGMKSFDPLNPKTNRAHWNLGGGKVFLQKDNSKLPQQVLLLAATPNKGSPAMSFAINCVEQLYKAMGKYCGNGQPPKYSLIKKAVTENNSAAEIRQAFQDKGLVQGGYLAILIIPMRKGMPGVFANFKRIADQEFGAHALCMTAEAASTKMIDQYMANVCMKLNVKLGHTNHRVLFPEILKKKLFGQSSPGGERFDTMILGADVTHPAPGGSGPSITAVVGSVDQYCGKFFGSVRYQEGGEEIIQDMEDMVKDRLRAFLRANKFLPSKILFYRDGVSDSMYEAVLQKEVRKVESAYAAIRTEFERSGKGGVKPGNQSGNPKITALIVTKRHHTRFYPKSNNAKENCQQGTCVESGVTHPCYFDFFLQSHDPLQGTAKPTYYFVLRNDMGFSAEEMQDLTNHLCYTYIRCTMPVGYVPAAYYADRLCDRARLYAQPLHSKVAQAVGDKPSRPPKGQKELAETRADKIAQWKASVDVWSQRVAEQWRKSCKGKGISGQNSVGPWHERLNDTMFWM